MTTLTRTPATHWRVMNALFYASTRGASRLYLTRVIRDQDVSFSDLCDMDRNGLIAAWRADQGIYLPSVKPDAPELATVELRLSNRGRGRVIGDPYNNVIAMIGMRPSGAARIRDIRAEAESTDELLIEMIGDHLITLLGVPVVPFADFAALPATTRLTLTAQGREYLPR